MGAFNELLVSGSDGAELRIQFKFGLNFQYLYRLGDTVEGASEYPGTHEIAGIAGNAESGWNFFAIKLIDGCLVSCRVVQEDEYDRLERKT